jgi:hypothetical protein
MNKIFILCQKSFKYNYFSLPFFKIKPPSVAFILQGFPIFHRITNAEKASCQPLFLLPVPTISLK